MHEDLIEYLKNNVNDTMSLSEIVNVFEKMCETPIENDMLLFETGVFDFSADGSVFLFCLVRQFPNEDEEYYQIHLDIYYKPSNDNKKIQGAVWNEDIEENFFDYIRSSKAFECVSSEPVQKIRIFMDET